MEGPPIEEIEEQNAIERIKLDTKKSVAVKRTLIAETKKSFAPKKQSSMKTILSLSNMMVGSSILVLPLKFFSAGFGSSIMAVIVMAFFTCITARIISFQLKSEEKDFVEAIERCLGNKWKVSYLISSQVLLWLGAIIYFLVVSNIMYSIVIQFVGASNLPLKDEITFSRFSYQWTGAILFVICFMLFNLRDLKVVLKISSKGIYCVAFYFYFITFMAVKSFILGKVSFTFEGKPSIDTMIFTECGLPSFLQALGIFTLSYMIHNLLSPVIKANHSQKKNPRDIAYSFVFGTGLLIYAGMVGLIALFWRQVDLGDGKVINSLNANTVMDLFDGKDIVDLIQLVISEALLCVQLLSVISIIAFLARTQLFNLVYGADGIPPDWAFYTFSVVFTILLYSFQIFNFKPMVLIQFAGTIGGYIIAYLIPVSLHLSSIAKLHKKMDLSSPSIASKSEQSVVLFNQMEQKEKDTMNSAFLPTDSTATLFLEDQKETKLPKFVKFLFYGSVILYGTLLIPLQFSDVHC